MNAFIEIIKAAILGVVEGITEWLPISSTGHMILVDEFLKMNQSKQFMNMFLVVIQLGAILAVVLIYWKKMFPFRFHGGPVVDRLKMIMWIKILIACIPAGIVAVFFNDYLEEKFLNYQVVAISLIVFGILFIVIENFNKRRRPVIRSIEDITYTAALWIGMFQLIAAVFPGTSRSGATIIGGIILGMSRKIAAEFTFFLAVPVMLGASLLKILKFGFSFSGMEIAVLVTGMLVAFIVSLFIIKFLMGYIRKHDFKAFGWYRIVLGCVVLVYFNLLAK